MSKCSRQSKVSNVMHSETKKISANPTTTKGFVVNIGNKSISVKEYEPLKEKIIMLTYCGFSEKSIFILLPESKANIQNEIINEFGSFDNLIFIISFLAEGMTNYVDIVNAFNDILRLVHSSCSINEIAEKLNKDLNSIHKLVNLCMKKKSELKKSFKPNENESLKVNENLEVSKNISNKSSNLFIEKIDNSLQNLELEKSKLTKLSETLIEYKRIFRVDLKEENLKDLNLDCIVDLDLRHALNCIYFGFEYILPFYPAEDVILKEYYSEIGSYVIDLLKELIHNYVVHPLEDYQKRVIELKVKTPHPNMGFSLLQDDRDFLHKISSYVKCINTVIIPWIDSFDLAFYCDLGNYLVNKSKKTKLDLSGTPINITKYLDFAKDLKEVKYHNVLWTSDVHGYLKNNFVCHGYGVLNSKELKDISLKECQLRLRQFKIKQLYTTKEVKEMEQVYKTKGFSGLKTCFPYRSEDALRYKVKEQGWDIKYLLSTDEIKERMKSEFESCKSNYYKEVEEKISKTLRIQLLEEITDTYFKKFREEESIRLGLELNDKYTNQLDILFDNTFELEIKTEIQRMMKNCNLKQVVLDLPIKISEFVLNRIKEKLSKLK